MALPPVTFKDLAEPPKALQQPCFRVVLQFREYFFPEKLFRVFRRNRAEFVVHENADTFLASAYAEHTRKLHLIRKPVLLDKLFELLDNNVRALDMAGRADTYLDLHANSFL